jgi:olefin beta-lactone synthetase
VPKGVEYQHRMFNAQIELLRAAFAIAPGTFNLPTFPPFALFDPALGCTSVIPMMDATKPAKADPAKLLSAIRQFSITNMFGSPALLRTLVTHLERTQSQIPELRCVMSAGAPVAPELVQRARRVLPNAQIFTPYGATEALPVSVVSDAVILGSARARGEQGGGICVGSVLAGNRVCIIPIHDDGQANFDPETDRLEVGQIGEICVHGPSVTHAYLDAPEKTALAKLRDAQARIWHRMGDLGYFDAAGLLWYCGRKSHRVETNSGPLYSECVEAHFNQITGVARTALVGLGARATRQQRAVVLYELAAGQSGRIAEIHSNLLALAQTKPELHAIQTVLHYPKAFPVDIRHNAKINREQLTLWASALLGS